VLILVFGYAAVVAPLSATPDDATVSLERVGRQVDSLRTAIAGLRPQLAELHARWDVARQVGDQPDWSDLLVILNSAVDDRIVMTGVRMNLLSSDDSRKDARPRTGAQPAPEPVEANTAKTPMKLLVALQGYATSQASVAQFVLRLEALGLFERVTLTNSNRQAMAVREVTTFRIECVIDASARDARDAGTRSIAGTSAERGAP
jgi:Tfp pilus assembly protein PilN